MANYRTRSNTQKLQRLIEFLKERDCDSAANLEETAQVFLNDVKPKAHIEGVPHYDGTESDDGSSYVEEAGEKSDDDWGSDWEEEEWEDCKEEPNKTEKLPSPIPPPKEKTPLPPSPIPPPKEKTPLPPPPPIPPAKEKTPPLPPPLPKEKSPSPPLEGWRRREQLRKEAKVAQAKPVQQEVILSGVERSSDVAAPLMRFPTLPVSIPSFFGSNSNGSSTNNGNKKEKKRSQVPEDAVESVLADSMCIASAVAVPINPSMAQFSKNNKINSIDETEELLPSYLSEESKISQKDLTVAPNRSSSSECQNTNSKDMTNSNHLPPLSNSVDRSSPVRIVRQLTRQDTSVDESPSKGDSSRSKCDSTKSQDDSIAEISVSSSFERVEKSPLRSILKKSASTHSYASSTDVSEYLPADDIDTNGDIDSDDDVPIVVSCSPSKVSIAETLVDPSDAISLWKPWSPEPEDHVQVSEEVNHPPESYKEIKVTIQEPVAPPSPKISSTIINVIESQPTISKLSALMEKSEDKTDQSPTVSTASPKPKPKKQVTLQVPEQLESRSDSPKPKAPGSPCPRKKKPEIKAQPQLQYNVPEDARKLKVAGQRSRKPTLAATFRMQKEKEKRAKQVLFDRQDSFNDENWPYEDSDPTSPAIATLAEAGFFYVGLSDCVQCNVCEIVLSGWKAMEEPDPWIQHAKTSPGCAFLEKAKGSSWLQEIKDTK